MTLQHEKLEPETQQEPLINYCKCSSPKANGTLGTGRLFCKRCNQWINEHKNGQ